MRFVSSRLALAADQMCSPNITAITAPNTHAMRAIRSTMLVLRHLYVLWPFPRISVVN